jgi:signal transduction histidine kinase
MGLGESLRLEVSFAAISAAASPFILWLAHRFRLERQHWLRNIALHAAASILLVMAEKLLWDIFFLPSPDSYFHKGFTFARMLRSVLIPIDIGAVSYWLILLIDFAFDYYDRFQRSQLEAARLQTQLVQAQLQALKMQLHPHFLFNTLHTISALVHEDPESAERTVARLSDLLRISLESSGVQEVPLRQELSFVQLYLSIEKTRFEERLSVEFRIDDDVGDAMVPSLVLQPLVENAIRHGLASQTCGGTVAIEAEREGTHLILRVRDNGCGLPPDPIQRRQGLGIANTRARLERLYGNTQSFVLRSLSPSGVEARIVLPFRRTAAVVTGGNHGPN